MLRLITLISALLLFLTAGCADQNASDVIRVAVSPASPPNLYEENGRTQGLDLEIFEGYCAARGCTLRITAYDWQGMLGAIVSRQADVAFSAISITEERLKAMDFSQPYMENTWNLVSLTSRNIHIDDLVELNQYTIGYPRGMAYSDFIKNDLEPKGIYSLSQVKMYPSYNEVLSDLQNGNLDLAFLDGTVASVYRKSLPISDTYVFTGFDRFGFAFPKGSELREDFDRYLSDELSPQALQAIIDKWLN
ncbi:MAG: transporter substrate-binding domain-containing protein [Porticoccaceae bacterium]|nr:transporter substrate-binding domain-containing protein [Porticoccaceae bacterium]